MAAAMKYNGRSDEAMERHMERKKRTEEGIGVDHNEELELLNHKGFTRDSCCHHRKRL